MTDPSKPRVAKSPQQRAQEAVDVETRRVTKLGKKIADLKTDLKATEAEAFAAAQRLSYRKQNPDLPQQPEQR